MCLSYMSVCLLLFVWSPTPHPTPPLSMSVCPALSVCLSVCECVSLCVWGYGGEGVSVCLRVCVCACAHVCGEGEGVIKGADIYLCAQHIFSSSKSY